MTGMREADDPTSGKADAPHNEAIALPRLLVGRLCLDFANTAEDRTGHRPLELVIDCAELARWGRHAGGLGAENVRVLLGEAARQPETARAVVALAIALREAIYRVFRSVAH